MPGIAPEWSSADYFDPNSTPTSADGWAELVEHARTALAAADYDAWVEHQLAGLDGDERVSLERVLRLNA